MRLTIDSRRVLALENRDELWLASWRCRLSVPVPIRWTPDKIKVLGVFLEMFVLTKLIGVLV